MKKFSKTAVSRLMARLDRPLTFDRTAQMLLLLVIGLSLLSLHLWDRVRALSDQVDLYRDYQPLAAAATQPAATGTGTPPAVTASDHILGSIDAPVTVVEYSDYECPFCKQFHPELKSLVDQYGGKVAWVYRHYPLSFHANAQKEAEAGECISQLGGSTAFWKYTDTIYDRTTSNGYGFALDKLAALAEEVGVNQQDFTQCLDSGTYADRVKQEESEGATAGVSGTPGSFLIKKGETPVFIKGAIPEATLKAKIDALLQ